MIGRMGWGSGSSPWGLGSLAMDVVLVAGLWLSESVWTDVATALQRRGHRPIPVSLPGVDYGSTTATLADQVAAVVAAVDSADRPVVVGHSAACSLAWMVADQRPEAIHSVVFIGGFPAESGDKYADLFEPDDGVMGFPGWEPFEGPDSVDLDTAAQERFSAAAVGVPEGVSKGTVTLVDDRRFDIPVVVVCPEFTPEQARGWIDAGESSELQKAKQVSFVNIDTGHWPMITQPAELASILGDRASPRR